MSMEKHYRRAIELLHRNGFNEFTNYMLFNFKDSPNDLYKRIFINAEMNEKFGIRITGFPMRFVPWNDIKRNYISPNWKWKYLRGIQCILLATHGMVSPNPIFLKRAFGNTIKDFHEILSMPDRYIIYRDDYENNGADEWRKAFRGLSESSKIELLDILAKLNKDRNRKETIYKIKQFRTLLYHYYPNNDGKYNTPHNRYH
jgi:hypothetical protein